MCLVPVTVGSPSQLNVHCFCRSPPALCSRTTSCLEEGNFPVPPLTPGDSLSISPWWPCPVLVPVPSFPGPPALSPRLQFKRCYHREGSRLRLFWKHGFSLRLQKDQESISIRTVLTSEFKSTCVARTHCHWLSFLSKIWNHRVFSKYTFSFLFICGGCPITEKKIHCILVHIILIHQDPLQIPCSSTKNGNSSPLCSVWMGLDRCSVCIHCC